MPVIDIRADSSRARSENNLLVASLQSVDDRIATITSRMATFNKKGVETGAVIKGLTKDGKEFTATLGGTEKQLARAAKRGEDFALSLKKISYKESIASAKALAAETKRMDEAWEKAARKAREFTAAQKELEAKARAAAAAKAAEPGPIAQRFDAALNQLARSAQYFVTYRAFGAITNEIEEGITAANKFQIQLSLIRTLSQQNQQTRGQFGEQVRRVSDNSGFSINDTAKAFYDAISNQVAKGAQVEAFTAEVAKLARVTGSDLTDAGNAVTATINAYGLSAQDAERVSAVLFRTIDEGRVVMSELANTLGRVQVLASNVGVSMEEVSSVLAVTTQKGFKTADAMTLLTNLLIKLEKPTEATKAFFQSLGVSSGEEAIRLYGFYGIMQKIVAEVRSGRTDVSAFFDEIRGRKQFAVFEQSIDQMQRFSEELSHTGQNIAHYRQAVSIRGESPADYLNNEINKLKNVFAVDVGQKILEVTAEVVKFTKTTAKIAEPIVDLVIPTIGKLVLAMVVYKGTTIAVNAANVVMATGFTTATNAILAGMNKIALRGGAVLAVLYAGYEIGKLLGTLGNRIQGATTLDVDGAAIERGIERINLLRRRAAEGTTIANLDGSNNETDLEQSANRATEGYRRLQGMLAQVNIANNRLLDDAKKKARETAEATRVAFTAFTDRLREAINEFKKNVTEARNEIEKSKRSLLSFREAGRDRVFQVQSQYATDEQRITLQRNRINELQQRADSLLAPGATADQRDEGRRLYDQIQELEAENFRARQDLAIARRRAGGGGGTYTVDTTELQETLARLTERRARAEQRIQDLQRERAQVNTNLAQQESQRLDRLQIALRNLQELSAVDDNGRVRPEFQTGGQFDRAKFEAEVRRREQAVRDIGAGTADQRFELEIAFSRFRESQIRQAAALQRSEDVQTIQAQLTARQEATRAAIEDERRQRANFEQEQTNSRNALRDRAQDFRGFRESTAQAVKRNTPGYYTPGLGYSVALPPSFRADFAFLDEKIAEYERLVRRLETNAEEIGGVRVARAADAAAVRAAAIAVQDAQNAITNRIGGVQPTVNGNTIGLSIEGVREDVAELGRLREAYTGSLERQRQLERTLEQLREPLERLRRQFPELATAADAAFAQVQRNADQTINQALQPLIDKVGELRRELDRLNREAAAGPGPRAALDFGGGELGGNGEVFAARGGRAGFFPGQPRGKDRYPIWAAKGEYIVNAESSKQFRPMLEAINNRRTPRYMAQGGVVGGDTNIGDINVTVNGGATNSDTGRAIASKLEREFRRGNLRRK